jgi:hypothetical protein
MGHQMLSLLRELLQILDQIATERFSGRDNLILRIYIWCEHTKTQSTTLNDRDAQEYQQLIIITILGDYQPLSPWQCKLDTTIYEVLVP